MIRIINKFYFSIKNKNINLIVTKFRNDFQFYKAQPPSFSTSAYNKYNVRNIINFILIIKIIL